jgi:hypothetical protein
MPVRPRQEQPGCAGSLRHAVDPCLLARLAGLGWLCADDSEAGERKLAHSALHLQPHSSVQMSLSSFGPCADALASETMRETSLSFVAIPL